MTTTYHSPGLGIQDRTLEFQQCVSTFSRQHQSKNGNNKYKSLDQNGNNNNNTDSNGKPVSKSEFSQRASLIAKDIARVTSSLSKLAMLAKQKQLFNERPTDMVELTYIIKQDIFKIERAIKDLQIQTNSKKSNEPQINTYNKNVVQLLNTKTKNISEEFKTVLEIRQRAELAQKTRQEQIFAAAAASANNNPLDNSTANNHNNNTNNQSSNNNNDNNNDNVNIPYALRNNKQTSENPFLAGLNNGSMDDDPDVSYPSNDFLSIPDQSQQLLLLEEQNNQYVQDRNRAVEAIESTIQEVGGLFQQLATMVQEQGEVIQRIDNNVEDISLNISGAQRELLKYYNHVSSNRWLMVKIFGILILFFLLWVLIS